MSERRVVCVVAGLVLGLGMLVALSGPARADAVNPDIIVPYEPSPPSVVRRRVSTKALLPRTRTSPQAGARARRG